MSLNVEKIKQRLDEFVRKQKEWELAHPEEAKRLKEEQRAEAEEEERQERSFWRGQEIAEEAEQEMIEGPLDEIHGTPELRRKVEEANADWKAEEYEKDLR